MEFHPGVAIEEIAYGISRVSGFCLEISNGSNLTF